MRQLSKDLPVLFWSQVWNLLFGGKGPIIFYFRHFICPFIRVHVFIYYIDSLFLYLLRVLLFSYQLIVNIHIYLGFIYYFIIYIFQFIILFMFMHFTSQYECMSACVEYLRPARCLFFRKQQLQR